MSDSSMVIVPSISLNCPFTFVIIMCLTLNSAAECAGSRFQVVVLVCAAIAVLIPDSMRRIDIRCNRSSIARASTDGQEFDQLLQSLRAQVTQLLAMDPLNRLVQTVEKG